MNIRNMLTAATFFLALTPLAQALTDGEIMEVLKTANMAEINAAKVASSKGTDAAVKDFAKHMIKQHSENDSKGKQIASKEKIQAQSNDTAAMLKKDSETKLNDLKKKKGGEFNAAYIASQVEMHQSLLTDLDEKFIPQAQNPAFKNFLTETRAHVDQHLAKAKEIQSTMTK